MVSNFDYLSLRINKTGDVCQFNSFSLNGVLRRTEHQENEIGIEKESYNLHIESEKGSLVCNAILLCLLGTDRLLRPRGGGGGFGGGVQF